MGNDSEMERHRSCTRCPSTRGKLAVRVGRSHASKVVPSLRRSSSSRLHAYRSGLPGGYRSLSAVAVTTGPGLAPCLNVGLSTAIGLAHDHKLDIVAVNHLEAHALVPRLFQKDLGFPFLVLLVSGGHCTLVVAKDVGDYDVLGNTVDDSVGEAFDKVARMLSLATDTTTSHGGKLVEGYAARGNPRAFAFTEPMKKKQRKRTAIAHLVTRTRLACELTQASTMGSMKHLVVCGGVAANANVRSQLQELATSQGLTAIFPPIRYCTDNGVMVAWAGMERFLRGVRDDPTTVKYSPRWPLDQLTPPTKQTI
ncbi:hypothetical protein, variant 4 [Aphanomyces astaci]|uniref:N(6)-L-threonylcarbamoyladenine synthase n=1 Tax=Aphanomyces astaci TaxID=112090 RepID=W4G7S1_APHAT|nr:hypothetical protein, variant 4 [Aphanomyces astaci]ETV75079.1 hypothetical protein, variant 4 [Aphanomyces astaci]|eukprot:XP_009835583.1 hypothetical protein, variant 4 [Aphanomyces astaci]